MSRAHSSISEQRSALPVTVTVIDYGVGNIGSVLNMFWQINVPATVTSSPSEIKSSDRILLPGVGAYDRAAAQLEESEIAPAIKEAASQGIPILGICLGMQLLGANSEEGSRPGLSLMNATFKRFVPSPADRLRVPHMGWARVSAVTPSPLFSDVQQPMRYYFAHSYHAECVNSADIIATTVYGAQNVVAAYSRNNVAGTQFHPEKSHIYGMQVLKNFAGWDPS